MLREPKKEEGVIKDWILQTLRFSLSQEKIAKENDFHAAVLFRGYTETEYCLHSCPHRTHTETFCY